MRRVALAQRRVMRSGDGRTAAECPRSRRRARLRRVRAVGRWPRCCAGGGHVARAGGLPEPAARRRRPRPRHRRVRGHVLRVHHARPHAVLTEHRQLPAHPALHLDGPRHVDPDPGYGPPRGLPAMVEGRADRLPVRHLGAERGPDRRHLGHVLRDRRLLRRRALPGGGHVDLGRRALCDAGLPPPLPTGGGADRCRPRREPRPRPGGRTGGHGLPGLEEQRR